jgi:hypothetical protein
MIVIKFLIIFLITIISLTNINSINAENEIQNNTYSINKIESTENNTITKIESTENNTITKIESTENNTITKIESTDHELSKNVELTKIVKMLESIQEDLDVHDDVSFIQSVTSNLVGILGGILGITGIILTIIQIYNSNKRKNEERTKIENTENKIKWTLGDILEYQIALNEKPPKDNELKSILAWGRIKEHVKVLRIAVTPIAKDLKNDLGNCLLGYIVFLEKQFEKAEKNEKISSSTLVNSTKSILNKHFPDHGKEREESRELERKNFEEQMKKREEEEMKAYARYVEEQGIVDEMIEERFREQEEEDEKNYEETSNDNDKSNENNKD